MPTPEGLTPRGTVDKADAGVPEVYFVVMLLDNWASVGVTANVSGVQIAEGGLSVITSDGSIGFLPVFASLAAAEKAYPDTEVVMVRVGRHEEA